MFSRRGCFDGVRWPQEERVEACRSLSFQRSPQLFGSELHYARQVTFNGRFFNLHEYKQKAEMTQDDAENAGCRVSEARQEQVERRRHRVAETSCPGTFEFDLWGTVETWPTRIGNFRSAHAGDRRRGRIFSSATAHSKAWTHGGEGLAGGTRRQSDEGGDISGAWVCCLRWICVHGRKKVDLVWISRWCQRLENQCY